MDGCIYGDPNSEKVGGYHYVDITSPSLHIPNLVAYFFSDSSEFWVGSEFFGFGGIEIVEDSGEGFGGVPYTH